MEVYLVRNLKNRKCYVGQTSTSVMRRFRAHVDAALYRPEQRRTLLHRAIREDGRSSFAAELLQVCAEGEDCDAIEQAWIEILGTRAPDGYNARDAGRRGRHADSTKALLRARVVSDETRARLRAAKLANPALLTEKQRDALALGRTRRSILQHDGASQGESNPNARLTKDQVTQIRAMYRTGQWSQQSLGERFGVKQVTISAIVRRRTWCDLPDEY